MITLMIVIITMAIEEAVLMKRDNHLIIITIILTITIMIMVMAVKMKMIKDMIDFISFL